MRRSSGEDQGQERLLRNFVRTAGTGMSRRRAQRTLGAAKIEAELANRAKTEFLANISHELRTPLNAIIGFADMIVHTPASASDGGKAGEYGSYIANAGRHLLSVLSDILDIAQIDGGTCKVERAPCDIGRALELSAACVKERMTAKHQLLSMTVEGGLPQLMIDDRRLQQAMINVLANASQSTQEGGCIGLRGGRNPSGGVTILVTDNGRGMSEDDLRRSLAPFAHVQSAYAANGDGIALGLAIAKRLIELQGASFTMTSVVSEGTQVEIKFSAASLVAEGAELEREVQ